MPDFLGYTECQNEAQARIKQTANLATVASVYNDGVTLILPGETSPSAKRYPYNRACSFQPGQRVHIVRESGTIIVEYPIGGSVDAASI